MKAQVFVKGENGIQETSWAVELPDNIEVDALEWVRDQLTFIFVNITDMKARVVFDFEIKAMDIEDI